MSSFQDDSAYESEHEDSIPDAPMLENESAEQFIHRLQGEIKQLTRENEGLKEDNQLRKSTQSTLVKHYEGQLAAKDQYIERMERTRVAQNAELDRLEAVLRAGPDQRIGMLLQQLNEAQDQAFTVQAERDATQAELLEVRENLQSEISVLASKNPHGEDVGELRANIEELEGELGFTRRAVEDLNEEITDLKKLREDSMEEIGELRVQCNELEAGRAEHAKTFVCKVRKSVAKEKGKEKKRAREAAKQAEKAAKQAEKAAKQAEKAAKQAEKEANEDAAGAGTAAAGATGAVGRGVIGGRIQKTRKPKQKKVFPKTGVCTGLRSAAEYVYASL